MSPRPFERPATIRLPETPGLPSGASLEGLWLPARGAEAVAGATARASGGTTAGASRGDAQRGAIVAAPHPLMGGSMDSPVVTELALAASDTGHVALRFNWRGVGASAGKTSGEAEDADADTRAALEFMQESVVGELVACGYSWGALAAFRTCLFEPRVERLVLVAPPASLLERTKLAHARKPILIVMGDRDDYVPETPMRELLDGLAWISLVVLPDVDHFFMNALADVGRQVRSWLAADAASSR